MYFIPLTRTDRRIPHLVESGIAPVIVGSAGESSQNNHPSRIESRRNLLREAGAQRSNLRQKSGSAVYGDPEQATKAGDALLIEVVRKDGSVLKSFEHTPGAWNGKAQFAAAHFDYQGDGSGENRLRISAAGNKIDDRFKGAIDNFVVKESK